MSALFTGVVSIAATRRRRFLWAAFWTLPPTEDPFQKPDASSGGARTREEAFRAAQAAAGRSLTEADPRWAVAWSRILRGEPPWPTPGARVSRENSEAPAEPRVVTPPREGGTAWAFGVLELPRTATAADVKKAFRAIALETHPDRGGDDAGFIRVKLAHDVALAAATGKPKARRRKP